MHLKKDNNNNNNKHPPPPLSMGQGKALLAKDQESGVFDPWICLKVINQQ